MKEWEINQIKRAIQSCKNKRTHHYEHTRTKVSNAIRNEDVKIKALEKQIPKHYTLWNGQCSCPNCKKLFGSYSQFKTLIHWEMPYCKYCGQALDWGDTE